VTTLKYKAVVLGAFVGAFVGLLIILVPVAHFYWHRDSLDAVGYGSIPFPHWPAYVAISMITVASLSAVLFGVVSFLLRRFRKAALDETSGT